ncbi:hypothetical protein [Streptomyces sp. NPDC051219]|uniref:FAD binding domain-containing protein n=1 Tax=Streptomyces sp. NPDC051219 TaxID=3155283 RepID=UPI00342DD7CB
MPASEGLSVVVVGGSLVGLAAAVALGGVGLRVEVFERSAGLLEEHGAGLGVDLELLGRLVGDKVAELPTIDSPGRATTSWRGLYELLREQAIATPGVTYHEGVAVQGISPSADSVTVETTGGEATVADVVVGADGYRSLIRRHVDPVAPEAEFAGYLLWRGVLDEEEVRRDPRLRDRAIAVAFVPRPRVSAQGGWYLITYPIPSASGGTGPGERRLSWNWYAERDGQTPWSPGSRPRTVLPSELAPGAAEEMLRASRVWSWPWPELMEVTVRRGTLFVNAIYEYLPRRVASERAVIVGDAAHVVTPMTGAGLINGSRTSSH